MKIKLLSVCALVMLSVLTAFAQVSDYTYHVSSFSSISIGDEFEATVVKGSDKTVTVYVDKLYKDYVICIVKGNTLTVGIDAKKVPSDVKKALRGKNPGFRISITAPEEIEGLFLSDKAVLKGGSSAFSTESVSISIADNSKVESTSIDAKYISVKMDNKSSAELEIAGEKSEITVSGRADMTGSVKSSSSMISIEEGGVAKLSCFSKQLEINSKGNSKLTVDGETELLMTNNSGSSNVDASCLKCPRAEVVMNGICSLKQAASDSLSIDISSGAKLIFAGNPLVSIKSVKSSTIQRVE